jgi:hypothetical protein
MIANFLCTLNKFSRLIGVVLIVGTSLSGCNTAPRIEHSVNSSADSKPATETTLKGDGENATAIGAQHMGDSSLKKLLIAERGILGAGPRASVGIYSEQAKAGDIDAQTRLGVCYYTGQGIEENKGEAKKWFASASEGNDKKAQFCLAYMLEHGEGGPEDKRGAFFWYQVAAEGNDRFCKLAQEEVDRLSTDFDQLEKDRVRKEVLDWYNLSKYRKTNAEKTRRSY